MAVTLPTNKKQSVARATMTTAPDIQTVGLEYADRLKIATDAMAAITQLSVALLPIELRRDRLQRRLDDPELAERYPADHPLRLEKMDRLDELNRLVADGYRGIRSAICDVDSQGRYLATPDLIWLGNHTDLETIDRLHDIEPECKRLPVWKTIAANALPF